MLRGQRRRWRAWGEGRGSTWAGDGAEAGVRGQDPGAGRPHPLPSPTADQGDPPPLCSWSLATRSAPGAVCTVGAAGAGRGPALLGAPGQTAKVAGSGVGLRGEGVGGRMGTGTWVGSLMGAGHEARWLGACLWPRGQIFLLSAGGCTSLAGGLEACGALELGSKVGEAGWWWGRGGRHEPEGSDQSFPHAHSHTHATHTPHAHRHAASASVPAVLISPRRGGRACASHRGAASSAVLIAGPPCFPGDLSMGPGRGCRAAQSSLGLAFVSRQVGGRLQLGRGPAPAGQAVGPLGGVGTA